MAMVMVVVLTGAALATSALSVDPHTMPNIGALLKGYDIMQGNPTPTMGLMVDPGDRQPVFSANYTPGDLTPDQRYMQPDGTSITSCSGDCSLGFSSETYAGTQAYQTSLSVKVSAAAGGWGAKFSASTDYKRVAQGSSSTKSIFTHSEAKCCAYQAKILTYTPPALHPNFVAGLKQLPESFIAAEYFKFIASFGTHYVAEVNMGALFGQQSTFSSTAWSQMLSDGLQISAAASYAGFGVTAAASTQTDSEKKMANTFSSASSEQREYSMGAKPPSDGKASSWVQTAIESPAPMDVKLYQLDTLLDEVKFPHYAGLVQIRQGSMAAASSVKANLQRALYEYCELLKNESLVASCEPPGVDPPFPAVDFPVDQMRKLTSTLSGITPSGSNIQEWMEIRMMVGVIHDSVTETNFPDKMHELLLLFSRINPARSNAQEWGRIRSKCNELSSSNSVDQFYGLVEQFSGTTPDSENTDEWTRIRATCNDILSHKPPVLPQSLVI